MAVPAWFNDYVYMKNKLAQMQAVDSTYTKSKLDKAFNDAGFSGTEGHYKHFVAYGNSENVSPNDYFDVEYYFTSKAAQFFNVNINDVTTAQVNLMKEAFDRVGLSAWDHYVKFGMAEGIDPSASFSTTEYFNDKLVLMQAVDPTYDMNQLIAAFKTANLNPVQHYFSYGKAEGLVPEPASSDGSAQNLTVGTDNLVGESVVSFDSDTGAITINDKFDDTFNAEVGTLQSEDKIDGLGGNDLLYARVNVNEGSVAAGSIEPTVTNVETVLFRSQIGSGDSTGNTAPVSAVIDADRISLADGTNLTIGSDNSRADLVIEDVRHYSNETTVRFADADPEVNFKLYFDPQHLKADDATTSGTLQIKLMDVQSADDTDDASPLATSPYNGFKILYNGSTEVNFQFRAEDQSLYKGDSANYDTLLTAVQHAIADVEAADSTLAGIFTASKGAAFTSTSVVDSVSYTGNGYIILVESSTGSMTAAGFLLENGSAPSSNRYVAEESASGTSDCPLIETKVELDNVGRVQWDDAYTNCLPNDIIKGSNAGDLQIGSMSMRSGIERMDLTVDRGSWLSGLYSTNNTLRMVTVAADDINGDGIKGNVGNQRSQDASMADDTVNGQLYIGAWEGKLDDQGNLDTNLTWADPAKLLSAHYNDGTDDDDNATDEIAGLHDVAVFDAATSGYTGDINIAAEITEDSYDKYLKSVDGVKGLDKLAPVGGYDKAFTYATGSGDDVVNMTVNGDIAADVDFAMNIDTGDGNDLVAFRYDDMTDNESVNNKYLQQVAINTGAGDDHVWFYSGTVTTDEVVVDNGGAVTVNAGAGADTIYVNQVDMMTGGTGSGVTYGPTNYNAVFVFNTNDPTVGVEGLNGATLSNNMLTGPAEFSLAAAPASNVNLYVTVNFKGFSSDTYSSSNVLSKVSVASLTTTNYTVSAETINQAIINAVENDSVLSGLLSAKDGAGHGLIIESLANGVMTLDDLSITFYQGTSAANATLVSLVDSKAQSTDAWYAPQFGTYEAADGDPFTGNDNNVHSQAVVNGGAGNDVIVLGTNGVSEDGYLVTFGDLTHAKEGATLTVTVDGKDYISTYNPDDGSWTEFYSDPDDSTTELTTVTGLTYDLTGLDSETGELTFTKDEDSESELTAAKAKASPEETEVTDVTDVTGGGKIANVTIATSATAQGETITLKIGSTTYTATSTAAATWGAFTPQPAADSGITISGITDNGADTITFTVTNTKATSTFNPTATETNTADPAVVKDGQTVLADNGYSSEVNFGVLSGVADGDEISVTVGDETATWVADTTTTPGTVAWNEVQGFTNVTANLVVEDGNTIVTVTDDAEFDKPTAATYLGDLVESAGEVDASGDDPANTGRDIVELDADFGNDYIVDFESGVDQVNVSGLGITKVESTGTDAGALTANEAVVATGFTAEAATGIFIQSEVTKLVTDGAIAWGGSNYGSAVVLLAEDNAAGQNVYTAALVTKASASATTTATVMGSLTLAADETIAAADLVGVSQLVDDPDLASA